MVDATFVNELINKMIEKDAYEGGIRRRSKAPN